jgi:hypothetical protein
LKNAKTLKLDIIYYKVQGESFLSIEIKLVNWWHMTNDMTKREIEKTFATYKKDENLQ